MNGGIGIEGLLAAFGALVTHLEARGVTTGREFGDDLRRFAEQCSAPDLAEQLRTLAHMVDISHRPPALEIIDGGKADNDDGPVAA